MQRGVIAVEVLVVRLLMDTGSPLGVFTGLDTKFSMREQRKKKIHIYVYYIAFIFFKC